MLNLKPNSLGGGWSEGFDLLNSPFLGLPGGGGL
jgi:hypothetical protein